MAKSSLKAQVRNEKREICEVEVYNTQLRQPIRFDKLNLNDTKRIRERIENIKIEEMLIKIDNYKDEDKYKNKLSIGYLISIIGSLASILSFIYFLLK